MRDTEEQKMLERTPTECTSHDMVVLDQPSTSSSAIPIKKKNKRFSTNADFDTEKHNIYISPSRRKTMLSTTMEPITCEQLMEALRTDPMSTLVLDCRDNKESFNVGHIISALHVPSFQNNTTPTTLEKSFPSYEEQIFFRQREFCCVVLYDDQYNRSIENDVVIDDIADDRLYALFRILREEALTAQVRYLKGGFAEFAYQHPYFCNLNQDEQDIVINSSNIIEEDENVVSSTPNARADLVPLSDTFEKRNELPHSVIHELTLQQRLKIAHGRLFSSFTRRLDCELPTLILDHLYLGSAQNSFNKKQLRNLQVRYIINTAKECVNHYPDHFLYMKCPMIDDDIQDATCYFDETYDYIENARAVNSKILVHCFMGMSRSATIVIAYLMKHKRWNLKVAYRYVREQRPILDLNVGFMYQLIEYEKTLLGTSSLGKIPFSPKRNM
jgi:protein-tyrosine phosphatase